MLSLATPLVLHPPGYAHIARRTRDRPAVITEKARHVTTGLVVGGFVQPGVYSQRGDDKSPRGWMMPVAATATSDVGGNYGAV